MTVFFDPVKDELNQKKHGVSLREAEAFEHDSALYLPDTREDYGEERFRAIGFLRGALFYLVFSPMGDDIRAISLRRTNRTEERIYAEEDQVRDAR